MKKETNTNEDEDDMRAEYDFSKMKFVGRGIYAERYRKGVQFFLLDNDESFNSGGGKEEQVNGQSRNFPHPTEW